MFLLFYSTDVRWHPSESYWDSSQTSLRCFKGEPVWLWSLDTPCHFWKKNVGHIWKLIQHCLVGGFNRLENYQSIGRIIPYIMENKKNVWNHQPVVPRAKTLKYLNQMMRNCLGKKGASVGYRLRSSTWFWVRGNYPVIPSISKYTVESDISNGITHYTLRQSNTAMDM